MPSFQSMICTFGAHDVIITPEYNYKEDMEECIALCMNNNKLMIDYLVTMSTTTANNATTVFNMFLTAVFGSFAFAAGIPLKNIGRPINFLIFSLSTSSLWVGFSLLSFYIISFISFNDSVLNAIVALRELQDIFYNCGVKTESVKAILSTERDFFGLQLISIGFIIGSSIGLGVFLWISNVDRKPKNTKEKLKEKI